MFRFDQFSQISCFSNPAAHFHCTKEPYRHPCCAVHITYTFCTRTGIGKLYTTISPYPCYLTIVYKLHVWVIMVIMKVYWRFCTRNGVWAVEFCTQSDELLSVRCTTGFVHVTAYEQLSCVHVLSTYAWGTFVSARWPRGSHASCVVSSQGWLGFVSKLSASISWLVAVEVGTGWMPAPGCSTPPPSSCLLSCRLSWQPIKPYRPEMLQAWQAAGRSRRETYQKTLRA